MLATDKEQTHLNKKQMVTFYIVRSPDYLFIPRFFTTLLSQHHFTQLLFSADTIKNILHLNERQIVTFLQVLLCSALRIIQHRP